ncbi:hypothetical protein [Legionella maioricensis]|uniref:Uncharacterized protein n=1 Tax=Legionella maioricensis TaxID=2896528 RepID=A0A9X2D1D4_9GAMM|nr:hypothetical protein [Legionella maioricensis]MCL9684686.1 hypothetical protein [Legionella maioricensis]MCL9687714.1 hypothetical protein [Legionella maioricensis]
MNDLTKYCLGMVFATHCFAESASPSLPPGLIKVTEENNPKCVEYITYQGEMYCSQVALDKIPVDPHILSYEKQNIIFGHRPWKAAWGKNTPQISTIEYIPIGDDIENWNELITTQFIPGLINITPTQFGNRFLDNLKKSQATFTVHAIENQPDSLIFEFKVSKPSNLKQDEIQKVVKGKDGMYILHYAIKKPDMGETARQKWIDNIKKSSLKED